MSDKVSKLEIPSPNEYNIQGKKHFVFNQTGNIMMSSTTEDDKDIPEEVRKVFAEVSVFFAAMTKSISQTINPKSKESKEYYSIYNYDALEAVIDGSGYFIHVTKQDVRSESKSVGIHFSTELISGVLGLAVGGAVLPFASAMVASIGKEGLDISYNGSSKINKVANIMFVC